MWHKFRKTRTGFTLMELLVAVALLAVVMATVSPFLINFFRHVSTGSTQSSLLQEGRWAIDFMSRELNFSQRSSIVITGGNSISFSIPGSTNVITYSVVNSEVCRQASAGSVQRPLIDATRTAVVSLSFTPNLDSSVQISVQVQGTDTSGNSLTNTLSSRVYPMN